MLEQNWIKLCHDRYENNEATRKPKSANDGLDFACLIEIQKISS